MPKVFKIKIANANKSILTFQKAIGRIKTKTQTEKEIKNAIDAECFYMIEENKDEHETYLADLANGRRQDDRWLSFYNAEDVWNRTQDAVDEDYDDNYSFKSLQLREFAEKYKIKEILKKISSKK